MDSPLLASPELVPPIIAEIKTETRRLRGLKKINENPDRYSLIEMVYFDQSQQYYAAFLDDETGEDVTIKSPFGFRGDRLWIRENWFVDKKYNKIKPTDLPIRTEQTTHGDQSFRVRCFYAADFIGKELPGNAGKFRPSIHLPRWYSRVTLEILDLYVERLHDITEESAVAEGVSKAWQDANGIFWHEHEKTAKVVGGHGDYKTGFQAVWTKLNGGHSWKRNPWVWVIKFKKIDA